MRLYEIAGRVVKGVNTTQDVGVDAITKQAAKFGNRVDRDGKPPLLHSKAYKNTTPNRAWNLGLTEDAAGSLGLTIFDIDDTLFRTTAQIKVVKDGEVVRSLNNQEFNTYQLQSGESFDFGEFQNAEKFNRESIPIEPMIAKLKAILRNAGDSKVIMLTARSDFDNKELFLDTFRKYGIDMNQVHVHRAGNLSGSPSQNKAVWIRRYLDTGKYGRVRLYDDAVSNIRMFIKLSKEYPNIKFFPYFVTHEGRIKTIRENTNRLLQSYTEMELAIMEGGHSLEDINVIQTKNKNQIGDLTMRTHEIDEDFTGAAKPGSRPGSLKRKAAKYLGKGAGDKLSKSDLRRLQAKANKMKKSEIKAERQRGIQLAKQVSWARNFGIADKE